MRITIYLYIYLYIRYTCSMHIIYIIRVIYIYYTCIIHIFYIYYTYILHLFHIYYTCIIHILYIYYTHTYIYVYIYMWNLPCLVWYVIFFWTNPELTMKNSPSSDASVGSCGDSAGLVGISVGTLEWRNDNTARCSAKNGNMGHTFWLLNVAMENGPFIDHWWWFTYL
jgi:hypothetical protein